MCWRIFNKEYKKELLTVPKTVYKIVFLSPYYDDCCYSFYKNFYYKKDKLYTTKLDIVIYDDGNINIGEGFHSFDKLGRITCDYERYDKTYTIWNGYDSYDKYVGICIHIAEFEIPVGTMVYTNFRGEIVSDKIIFKSIVDKV